jgi:hypothetical protein
MKNKHLKKECGNIMDQKNLNIEKPPRNRGGDATGSTIFQNGVKI